MLRQGAWTAAALLASLVALRSVAGPAEGPHEREANLAARDHKAAQARVRGYWIVERGEHLRLIAQQFFHGDRERQARLRAWLVEHDPAAFVHGDPDRLIPGARLELPADLVPANPPSRAKVPVSANDSKRATAPSSPPSPPAPIAPPAPSADSAGVPEFSNAPRAAAAKPAPAPYVDQLIEGGAEEAQPTAAEEQAAMLPGQRSLSAEYRAELREPPGGGHGFEQGVELHARRETLNYGDLYLETALRDSKLAPGDASVGRRYGGRFTLYQQSFPVTEGWLADSTFGVARTPPVFLTSSYRIYLPTSLFAGASTVVSDGGHSFVGYAGHIGRLEGSAVQTFDPTTGDVAGLAYAQRIGAWTMGAQAIRVAGSAVVPDHDAATLGVEYGTLGDVVHDKAQVVADDHSHLGAWFDGDWTSGRLRQRFGLYHLDPGLQWSDAAMINDQRGAYWRGDYQMLRYTVSGGVDLLQTNLHDDPSRTATRSGSGYGIFSLRIDRNLTLGGGLTYQHGHERFSSTPDVSSVTLNAYATWTNPIGLSRFDLTSFRGSATATPDNTIDTLSWSQEWPAAGPMRWSSTLTYSSEDELGLRTRRSSMGISGHGPLLGDSQWDASVVYGRIDGPQRPENDFNVSANATWPFARNWVALAQVSWTTFQALPILPGTDVAPTTLYDKRILLGVRYEESSGRPYSALGLRNGPGSGRLSGIVFFDENGDGIRQPTERGAANLTIYLDSRFPVTTDAQGRFAFPVVSPGTHSLRILNESLPLPWSVDDQHLPVANVPLRGDAEVDIPLTKIRP